MMTIIVKIKKEYQQQCKTTHYLFIRIKIVINEIHTSVQVYPLNHHQNQN